jgi:hypothetical protein
MTAAAALVVQPSAKGVRWMAPAAKRARLAVVVSP